MLRDFDVELGGIGRRTMERFHWHIRGLLSEIFCLLVDITPSSHYNVKRRSSGYRFLPVSEDNCTIKPLCACLHHLQAQNTFNDDNGPECKEREQIKKVIILRAEAVLLHRGDDGVWSRPGQAEIRNPSSCESHLPFEASGHNSTTRIIQWLRWNQNDLVFLLLFLWLRCPIIAGTTMINSMSIRELRRHSNGRYNLLNWTFYVCF